MNFRSALEYAVNAAVIGGHSHHSAAPLGVAVVALVFAFWIDNTLLLPDPDDLAIEAQWGGDRPVWSRVVRQPIPLYVPNTQTRWTLVNGYARNRQQISSASFDWKPWPMQGWNEPPL